MPNNKIWAVQNYYLRINTRPLMSWFNL